MATAGGPKIVTDGLVFGYDTNYGVADNTTATRFYAGEPATNLYGDINTGNARPSQTEYNTSNWTATDFPKPPEEVGRVYKHTSGALNSTWSGNSYGYILKGYTYLANTTYTLSCWVYVSKDANLNALHQSMEGATLTHTANRWYDMNNKGTWQQLKISCNSSSNVNGNAIIVYPNRSGVTDGSFSGFFAFGGAKLEINDSVTPYVLGTRSSTASLIDLKETADIDVSNVSFDSTGQPTFDGSDDRITMPAGSYETIGTNNFTIEAVCKNTKTSSYNHFFSVKDQYHFAFKASNTGTGILYVYRSSSLSTSSTVSSYIPSRSEYYHIVCKREGDNLEIFVNGVSKGTKSGWNNISIDNNSWPSYIGWGNGSEYTGGDIPIVKVYNKALTATEIKQNYNAYKNRFSI
jgi:hypothetical protein